VMSRVLRCRERVDAGSGDSNARLACSAGFEPHLTAAAGQEQLIALGDLVEGPSLVIVRVT